MAKQFQLNVPQPCGQSWEEMSPSGKGRFCDSCQKQVIDFTGMSKDQLALFFQKMPSSVCGRFHKRQLETVLAVPEKRIAWLRHFFTVALPALLVSPKLSAQSKVTGDTLVLAPQQKAWPGEAGLSVKKEAEPERKMLKGRVTDQDGKGIAFATIRWINTMQGTIADSAGYFRLEAQKSDSLIQLEVWQIGYERRVVEVDSRAAVIPTILLESNRLEEIVLGAIVAVPVRPVPVPETSVPVPGVAINQDSRDAVFRVYPNPVMTGAGINLALTDKLEEGYYRFSITSPGGRLLSGKEIWIDRNAKVLTLELPGAFSGICIVGLTNRRTGRMYTEKVMVQ